MSPGRLDGLLAGLRPNPSADYGLVIEDLGSGERLALNETRVFPSGSVYKLALAWQVLREVDLGRIELDQPLEILAEDTIEDEPVGGLSAPDTRTVHQALRAMFTVSSNAAAHALLRLIGRGDFNQAMRGLGLSETRVPEEPDAGEALTTADDVARMMRLIATQRGLSMPAQAELHDLLTRGGVPDALRETLADEVVVLDKTGNLEDASNVGALLFTPRGGVILVVLNQGVDPGDARSIIAQLGQAAYTAVLE
jgi:beta-lactamase class A